MKLYNYVGPQKTYTVQDYGECFLDFQYYFV